MKMPDADRMEALSRAHLAAVAAAAAVTLDQRAKDFGIDATLHNIVDRDGRIVEAGVSLDVQLKSTARVVNRPRSVAIDLEVRAYDDLRMLTPRPRILAVLIVPKRPQEWVRVTTRQLVLRQAMYWLSLSGRPAVRNRSSIRIRIEIPKRHLFTPTELQRRNDATSSLGATRMTTRWTPAELRRIPVEALHEYLTRRGWSERPFRMPLAKRFENGDVLDSAGRIIPVVVAETDRFPDYPLTVLDFLSTMGGIYDTDPVAVYAELTASAVPATV